MIQFQVPNVFPVLRQRLAIIGLASMVLLGSAALQPVAAERVPTNGDSHQIGCRALQDSLIALADEYGKDSTSDERALEILANIRRIGATWLELHCDSRYGSISTFLEGIPIEVPGPGNPLNGDLSPDEGQPAGSTPTPNSGANQPAFNGNAADEHNSEQGGKRKHQHGKGGKHGKGNKGGKRHR